MAIYYVKPTGNNNANGTSHATAWQSLNKVNLFNFANGDQIYFECGGTWPATASDNKLIIDWGGTALNRAIIGAYYWDGSTEVIGISGTRPIIDGGNVYPTSNFSGLVDVRQSYVTIQDLIIQASNGQGINAEESPGLDQLIVSNCLIQDCIRQAILLTNTNDAIVEYCEATNVNNIGNGAVIVGKDSNRAIIRYNHVHESAGWSEGINAFLSDDMQIIGNIVYDCWAMGIYLDHARNTIVKYNIVYYTTNQTYWRKPGNPTEERPSNGIGLSDEAAANRPDHLGTDQTIMYNYVAACGIGLNLNSNATTNLGFKNAKIIGNTFVEQQSLDGTQIAISIAASSAHTNSIFKNNIILQTNGAIAAVPNTAGIDFDYNLWSRAPEADAQGPNDPAYANPLLTKTSGWDALTANVITGAEFDLQQGSPAIGTGLNLGSALEIIPDAGSSTWPTNLSDLTTTNIILETQVAPWDIGADFYTSDPVQPSDITFVNSVSNDSAVGGDIAFTLPAYEIDDFALIFCMGANITGNFSVTAATGWTLLNQFQTADGFDRTTAIFYKKLSAGETNPTVNYSASLEASASIHIFRNVDPADPWASASPFYTRIDHTGNDITPPNPSITTDANNAAVVVFHGHSHSEITAGGAPAGYTFGEALIGEDRNNFTAYLLDTGAAGLVSPGDWTHSGTAAFSDATTWAVALKPAVQTALTLNNDFISSSYTTPEPTVSPGPVTISADYIASGNAIYEPSVFPTAITLSNDFISSNYQIHEPSVIPGESGITADFISSAYNIYDPSVTEGAIVLANDYISTNYQVFEPIVSPGAVTITNDFIASSHTIYEPSVSQGTITLSADYISTNNQLFEPTLSPGVATLTADFVNSSTQIFDPSVVLPQTVSTDFISSSYQIFEPVIGDINIDATDSDREMEQWYYAQWEALRLAIHKYYNIDDKDIH